MLKGGYVETATSGFFIMFCYAEGGFLPFFFRAGDIVLEPVDQKSWPETNEIKVYSKQNMLIVDYHIIMLFAKFVLAIKFKLKIVAFNLFY